jgi:hypothetical protein
MMMLNQASKALLGQPGVRPELASKPVEWVEIKAVISRFFKRSLKVNPMRTNCDYRVGFEFIQ